MRPSFEILGQFPSDFADALVVAERSESEVQRAPVGEGAGGNEVVLFPLGGTVLDQFPKQGFKVVLGLAMGRQHGEHDLVVRHHRNQALQGVGLFLFVLGRRRARLGAEGLADAFEFQ